MKLTRVKTFFADFKTNLRQFWYGPPCKHGVYGVSYCEGVVITCDHCMKAIAEAVREDIAHEQAQELYRNPAFRELMRRVSRLEAAVSGEIE